MSLFLLTFIIPILMLLIDIRTPYPLPLLYIPPTHSASLFYQLLIFSPIFLPILFYNLFCSVFQTLPLIFSLPPASVFPFRIFRTDEKGAEPSECFFVCHTFVQFFLSAVLYTILVLFICSMSVSWFILAQDLRVLCLCVSVFVYTYIYICVCVCVCVCVCAHLFPEV